MVFICGRFMKVEEECDAARKTRGMEESEGPRATRWKSRNEANRERGTQSAQRLRSKIERSVAYECKVCERSGARQNETSWKKRFARPIDTRLERAAMDRATR